uniref:DUF2442 domain-containing protein n=1 Tax=Candidatus Kentrum sp. FW TaxID=2126338 RepID=A0A450TRC8_9GAMM|nr:MAG: Protein of unknown function (DUF2442) [Candidatus Kentron sp. FW]
MKRQPMWNLNNVTAIGHREDYVYHIAFDDGVSGNVNFAEYLDSGPVFEPLKDPDFFRKATMEGGTIAWPNGADIAPETLYEKIVHGRKPAGGKAEWTGNRHSNTTARPISFISIPVPPHAEQESEEMADEVIARFNPDTREIENLEMIFFSTRLLRGEIMEPVTAELRLVGEYTGWNESFQGKIP